jgi:hypothetical protein
MTLGQGIELGPFTFTVIRMLVGAGMVRVLVRREWLAGGFNALDWLVGLWGGYAIVSTVLYPDFSSEIVPRLGMVYNAGGIYFLLRVFCSSVDDVVRLCRISVVVLALVALEMCYEHVAQHNLFSIFGGVEASPEIRNGRLRASGPFAHSILAGTVGAVTLPIMVATWPYQKAVAAFGAVVCLTMVLASSSSGPALSSAFGLVALFMWQFRHRMRVVRWSGAAAYLLLMIVMNAPPYYLLARIDLVGGSTGWHRARLIETSIEHLGEWWLGGTNYTRHWMPTGVPWSLDHTDITNYYLKMGITGGLPLMLLFIAMLAGGFSLVGRGMRERPGTSSRQRFVTWGLGCSLFAHAATCISVSYFDQSFLFLYLTLAAIGSSYQLSAQSASVGRDEIAVPEPIAALERWVAVQPPVSYRNSRGLAAAKPGASVDGGTAEVR